MGTRNFSSKAKNCCRNMADVACMANLAQHKDKPDLSLFVNVANLFIHQYTAVFNCPEIIRNLCSKNEDIAQKRMEAPGI